MSIVLLPIVTFRVDESKILAHRLKVNGVNQDLTGWTLELYLDGSKLKTISTASDPATQGQVRDQVVAPGEYFFTILAADLAPLLAASPNRVRELRAHVRYTSPDASPPRIFSNVEFAFVVKSW